MQVVLRVEHRGKAKMCGKAFPAQVDGKQKIILLHQSHGDQWHHQLDSPGGVDAVVLDWMIDTGVDEYHHWDTLRHTLYAAEPMRIKALGITQYSDDRYRYYLPVGAWSQQRMPVLPYRVPWITADKVIQTGS
jgi:hypothetical protein